MLHERKILPYAVFTDRCTQNTQTCSVGVSEPPGWRRDESASSSATRPTEDRPGCWGFCGYSNVMTFRQTHPEIHSGVPLGLSPAEGSSCGLTACHGPPRYANASV